MNSLVIKKRRRAAMRRHHYHHLDGTGTLIFSFSIDVVLSMCEVFMWSFFLVARLLESRINIGRGEAVICCYPILLFFCCGCIGS